MPFDNVSSLIHPALEELYNHGHMSCTTDLVSDIISHLQKCFQIVVPHCLASPAILVVHTMAMARYLPAAQCASNHLEQVSH